MTLTFHDKGKILKEFPITELSYEKKIYKKVSHSDFYIERRNCMLVNEYGEKETNQKH